MNRTSLNIMIIHSGPFPWNRGIGQLYSILINLGHNPIVLSKTIENRFFDKKDTQFKVIRMRKSNSLLDRILTYPTPINFLWKSFVYNNAKKANINILFIRESTLLLQTLPVAKKLNIPCFLDMRENMSLLRATSTNKNLFNIFEYPKIINFYESFLLPKCSHIFTVTEELKEWIATRYNIPLKNISILPNYPDSEFITKCKQFNTDYKQRYHNPIKLVFTGVITQNRGIQDIIRSLPIVNKKYNCTLTVIGEGAYIDKLKHLTEKFNLVDSVKFESYLPPEDLACSLVKYDIGICPYLLDEFTNQTMPGKLFEYMAVGLPILSSARKPVVKVLQKDNCGIIYRSRDSIEIADKLIYMIENEKEILRMGRNGRDAILNSYNEKANLKVLDSILRKTFANKS